MMKKWLFFTLIPLSILADYHATISPIDATVQKRMAEKSWHRGCPVPLGQLRYLQMRYRGFDGQDHTGEMIVHQAVASEVVDIFHTLYIIGYPIRQMRLVSDFGGNDWQSIEADNTSAFNCRKATGSKKWSKHSYGKAIDINPIENPYISQSGHISHKASYAYKKRRHHTNTPADRAVLLKSDRTVRLFKTYGWKWGGEWYGVKDYQHFSK